MNKKPKVLLGMSGGVDSSVSAILLKEQGYDVIGITMKLFEREIEGSCCSMSSAMDAKRVCDYLGIPHYTLNFKDEFKKYVIDDFINCYDNCKTPNPCIECNKHIKFPLMYKKMKELQCDYIATGHYAKIEYSEEYKQNVLKKANASSKDQSYVLYNLSKEILNKLKLPLGTFNDKSEVRKIASNHNLIVANKPDSEDICFIPDGNYKEFLEKNSDIKATKGNIVNSYGKMLGIHTGLYKYTIGQRRGIGISNKKPLYVIEFNKNKNWLIVGEENKLYKKEFIVSDINWLLFDKLDRELIVDVKIRYSSKPFKAKIINEGIDSVKVICNEPQKQVTPGQSAVFYIGDILIGGGKIK